MESDVWTDDKKLAAFTQVFADIQSSANPSGKYGLQHIQDSRRSRSDDDGSIERTRMAAVCDNRERKKGVFTLHIEGKDGSIVRQEGTIPKFTFVLLQFRGRRTVT
jgi:hypothetical protein